MASVASPVRPAISFCPSSVRELFSVQYNGKTHDLPYWQKTAIVITGIVGIALFGIGVLLGFYLSYCLRNRLVEQICVQPSSTVVGEPEKPNPVFVEQLAVPDVDADLSISERVQNARAKIDALRTFSKGKPTLINNLTLKQWSFLDRHFVYIKENFTLLNMPDFAPLALPKGIYCVYSASTNTVNMEAAYSAEFNKVMENEFGSKNLYHLIIVNQATEKPVVEKIHAHQLELTAGPGNIQVNAENIAKFKQEVAHRIMLI